MSSRRHYAAAPLGFEASGEVFRIFVGFDDVADAQGVNVRAGAPGKAAGGLLIDHFGQGVAVGWVYVVVLFFEGQRVRVDLPVSKANAIGGFAGGDDDFVDPERVAASMTL